MNKPRTCDELGVCQHQPFTCASRAECHVSCTPPPVHPMPIEMEGPYQRPRSAWHALGTMALWAGVCGLAAGLVAGIVLGGL